MILWRRIPAWFLRAWPVIGIVPFILLHVWAIHLFSEHEVIVNEIAGMLLQMTGGILIIYSINENLGMFRNQTIAATALQWMREFPISRRIAIRASFQARWGNAKAEAKATAELTSTTVEERLNTLERNMLALRSDMEGEVSKLRVSIDTAKSELNKRVDTTAARVGELAHKLEHSVVGGFKVQTFGVLLAVYGAFVSVFA